MKLNWTRFRKILSRAVLAGFCVLYSSGRAEGNLTILGSALLTDIVDLDYHGNRALGAFTGGVVLLDLSNPDDPLLTAILSTHEPCSDCILTDSIAFVACGSQGVLIIEAADTLGREPLATIGTVGSAEGIFLSPPYLYIATTGYGLEIFDVSDPAFPSLVAGLPLDGSPSEVWVAGSTGFISDTSKKLWVIDVSEPDNPSLYGYTVTRGLARDVTVMDSLAILAEDVGITSYDVSNPNLILPVDSVDTPGRALDLFLEPPRLYVADDVGGTHLFTITAGGFFQYKATMQSLVPSEDARGVTARNDTVLIGEDMTGVLGVDWGDTLSPKLIGLYEVPGNVRGCRSVDSDLLAVAEGSKGLRIVRMLEGGRAEYLSLLDLSGGASSIEVKDTLAFIASGSISTGVNIVNIADPSYPELLSFVSTGREVLEARTFGDWLYVVDGDFKVIDISDPVEPGLVGSLLTPNGYSNDLFVQSAARIYLANGSEGLLVVDATIPDEPEALGSFRIGRNVLGVYVLDTKAFVAEKDSGLVILDVSDPAGIEMVSTTDVGGSPLEVAVSGNRAFLTLQQGAVVEVDVSEVSHPELVSRYETPDMSVDLWISSDTLIVSDRTSLILLRAESVDIKGGESFITRKHPKALLPQNYPNPFNPRTTIDIDREQLGRTNVGLLIYDIRGRLVNRLPVPAGRGKTRIVWDGRDLAGAEVPSGVYLYRIESVNGARKMLLLR